MDLPTWQWMLLGIVLATGILLTLGVIPQNRWVGLRTARTLGDRDDWYAAHRALGLITLGFVTVGMLLRMWPVHPLFDAIASIFTMIAAVGLYAIVQRRYAV